MYIIKKFGSLRTPLEKIPSHQIPVRKPRSPLIKLSHGQFLCGEFPCENLARIVFSNYFGEELTNSHK